MAFIRATTSGGAFKVAETDTVGVRLSLAGKPDMASLGTALILYAASQGPTWNPWLISIAPPDLS